MEQGPKRFAKRIIKVPRGFFEDWEWEDDGNPPELGFKVLQKVLEKYGLDLTKGKVLEVGSGNTEFLNYIRKNGVDAVGVEIRPRGNKESPQVVARIEQLPFPDGSFDIILSSQVFDNTVYNQDQNLMIKEITRVLKHGGMYFARCEEIDVSLPKELKKVPDLSGFDFGGIYQKS